MKDIEILEHADNYVGIHYVNGVEDTYISPFLHKAIKNGISALREQEEREKGCPVCSAGAVLAWDMCNDGIIIESNGKVHMLSGGDWETEIAYCPKCGRRLSDEYVRAHDVPIPLDVLREMGGEPYYHVGLQADSQDPHWAILDSFVARHPEDYGYGKRWLAYRSKPKE